MAKNTPKPKEVIQETDSEELSESYISIGLGLLVVVVVGILLYNYFTQRNKPTTENPIPSESITQEATSTAKPGATYTIQAGDTLWSISEKSYGTGYNWQKIAEANDLSNSDQLVAGQEIKIPEVIAEATGSASTSPIALVASPVVSPSLIPTATPVVSATPVASIAASASPLALATPVATPVASIAPTQTPPPASTGSITGTSYTIVHGDTLWDIACRAYGDCYAWTKIAQANSLVNPNIIHAGNTLTLPR